MLSYAFQQDMKLDFDFWLAMKLYFSPGKRDVNEAPPNLSAGMRNVMLSYAFSDQQRPGFQFWLDPETRQECMKLYFAAAVGADQMFAGGGEGAIVQAGVRNRLLSYAAAIDRTLGSGPNAARFWIEYRKLWLESTDDERAEFMKLYFAGNLVNTSDLPPAQAADYATGVRNRLASYAFKNDLAATVFAFWIDTQPQDVNVFLDSGAFSVHTLGRRIDLGAYCDYIKRHKAALTAYAVLDVIGDSVATRQNMHTMRAQGLDPVAIYHVGSEKLAVLEDILSDKAAYVALGGMASERPTREELQGKLDPCWKILEKHWPVRVHGLGVMAQWALERYPFYSVDSSSAIMAAGMGRVGRFPTAQSGRSHWATGGQICAEGWRTDIKQTLDGPVADGIGRTRASDNKSESAHAGRRARNIQAQLAMERYLTDLWTSRGVVWTE